MPRFQRFKWTAWADAALAAWETDRPTVLAVDTETEGLEFYDAAFCATVSWRRADGELSSWYFEFEEADARDQLRTIITGTPVWVCHNAKFDWQKLILEGVIDRDELERHELHDTATIYTLLDENSPKALKKLAVSVLKWHDTITLTYKSGKKKGQTYERPREDYVLEKVRKKLGLTKEDGYHLLPRRVIVPYAMRDTDFTLRLYEVLYPKLRAKDAELNQLYIDSMVLALDVLDLEADGLGLDEEELDSAASAKGVELMTAWQKTTDIAKNPELNPNAPAQIMAVLNSRGLYPEDTQADTLEKLDDDEFVAALLEYRGVKKIHDVLRELQRIKRDGIAHPSLNLDGAKSGRFSSGKSAG